MRWMRLRISLPAEHSSAQRLTRMQISRIMRNVLVIPETKILTELLDEFRERKRHLAVVVDEFGSTAGVITVEDILAQLAGQIQDEFDLASEEPEWEEGALVLDGATTLRDLESEYEVILPTDGGYETLAGFMLTKLQKIPREKDTFDFESRRFTVEEMEGNRIAKVKLERLAPAMQATGD